jgi:arsenate reductase-like glutaredoxin family protein
MIVLILVLLMISAASLYAFYRSVKRNFELVELLEETNEQIETAIETLNHYYKRIDKKTKLELFSDDPAVRELVEDMKQARRAVLLISEKLTGEKSEEK